MSAAAAPAAKKAKTAKKAKKAAAGNGAAAAAAPPANPPTFTVNVQDTNPIMLYCAQAQHCQQGMVSATMISMGLHMLTMMFQVMVINPSPNGATSLAAYQKSTANAGTNTPATGGVTGGTLANGPNAQAAGNKAKKAKKAKGAAGVLANLGKKKTARKLRM